MTDLGLDVEVTAVAQQTSSTRVQPAQDYDPMIFDVMRETATRLGGEYVWLSRQTHDADERDRWTRTHHEMMREVRTVDSTDRSAVEAMTAELARRFAALRAG